MTAAQLKILLAFGYFQLLSAPFSMPCRIYMVLQEVLCTNGDERGATMATEPT